MDELLQHPAILIIRKYCEAHGKNFELIQSWFAENPIQMEFISSGRGIAFPARVFIEQVIGRDLSTVIGNRYFRRNTPEIPRSE